MRVFAYAFKAGKWVETPRLSVRDVALLVDTEGRTIYIWHGPKSKIKDQNEAKKLLLSLRDRYSSFQFQKVGRTPEPALQAEIKRLLGSPLGQGKTRIFAIAGMIAGLAGVGLGIFVIMTLYGQDATVAQGASLLGNPPAFNVWLEQLTWYTGFGMIAFAVAGLFSALSKRKYMLVSVAIGIVMGLLAIFYIDFWRNPTPWPASDFALFQDFILLMELVAFVPFLLGFIVEIVRIAQE
ncbi:MAG TPA: hypothetical protein VKM55_05165 [Candidatus Lokiarchaeia archaeon]|nr:hypothetical protein [Candidatus Lokiarchaeia archaeon]